jgi:transcriptional antiterminator RfaH
MSGSPPWRAEEMLAVQIDRQWFVVKTKTRREEYAQDQLIRRGIDSFLPRILEAPRSGSHPSVGPLFPGYLFARIDLSTQFTRVVWTPGVRSLVAFGDVPAPVDSEVVEFLRERCGSSGIVSGLPAFHDGDLVRVKRGPLAGLVGVVEGGVSATRRVEVLMDLLRRRTRVSLPVELLEHAAAM